MRCQLINYLNINLHLENKLLNLLIFNKKNLKSSKKLENRMLQLIEIK